MQNTENIVRPSIADSISTLAGIAGEEFVLAVMDAYLAGVEKGKTMAAQGAV